jgi:LysM repeat protein
MTERGQPTTDGSPACPFVAFDDDRDARADRPDHRHRCFAEGDPAPRALAHQEAYCLSSAFPVCPTFQAWARREAAQARSGKAAADAAADGAAVAAAGPADAVDGMDDGGSDHGAEEWTPDPVRDDSIPIESQPRRNPPRDWAAPPPWATGGPAGSASTGARSAGAPGTAPATPGAPEFLTPPRSGEGQGLAGSAADRLANGESVADVMTPVGGPAAASPRSTSAPTPRTADYPSTAPDPELAGLVGGAVVGATAGANPRPPTPMTDAERAAAGYPPPGRGGRRPSVSSTRSSDRSRDQSPQLEHVQHDGPAWEHARRYEAYPTIKNRAGFGGMPGLPRVAVLAGALGVAALALFFLPALLGLGGGGGSGASPTPSTSAIATTSPSPTVEPAPTPQVYVIKQGDTLSKIAKRNGITLDQLLAANKETIKNPDKISIGDEIIIPVPVPEEVTDASPEGSIAP